MGWGSAQVATIIMTDCTQYNSQQMADASHATDGTSTTITAETCLQYESAKQGCTRTDPLADILNNINKTMTANVNMHTHSSNKQSGHYEQQSSHNQEGEENDEEHKKTVTKNEQRQEKTNVPVDKRTSYNHNGVIKTKSGWLIKKPDRLGYI